MAAHDVIPPTLEVEEALDTQGTPDEVVSKTEDRSDPFAYYLTEEFTARLTDHLYRARRKALSELDESR